MKRNSGSYSYNRNCCDRNSFNCSRISSNGFNSNCYNSNGFNSNNFNRNWSSAAVVRAATNIT